MRIVLSIIISCLFFLSLNVLACDLCAVYSSDEARNEITTSPSLVIPSHRWRSGVFEQFTHFGVLKDGGSIQSNDSGQFINSSVTQIYTAYQISSDFSVQINIPFINRSFERPSGLITERGTVSGLGDATFLAQWLAYKNFNFSLGMFGGIKIPTGNATRISEELNETDPLPGASASGVHGHDLALGSGSTDFIIGTTLQGHAGKFVLPVNIQYAIRTVGSYGYQYANDFTWQTVPGYYVFLQHEYAGIVGLAISGESKGKDNFQGKLADDTGASAIYVGPQFTATFADKMSAMLAIDLPIIQNETSFQLVPDSRVRALLSAQL